MSSGALALVMHVLIAAGWMAALVGIYSIVVQWLKPSAIMKDPQDKSKDLRWILAETSHTRFRPTRHSFRYPLFYFALNLRALEGLGTDWWLFRLNRWHVFSIWETDYLFPNTHEPRKSLQQRLLEFLESKNCSQEVLKDVGAIWLVTTPRVFGYSFNPLSVYYMYSAADPSHLLLTVLEVHNTFSERHIYICDERNVRIMAKKPIGRYEKIHDVERSFHVSPFNNRSGSYEAHLSNPIPTGHLDVLLHIRLYHDDISKREDPKEASRLCARVWGTVHEWNLAHSLYLLLCFPFSAVLTFPRILWEAGKLAFIKKLKVYACPIPLMSKDHDLGVTVLRKTLTPYQRLCAISVLRGLSLHALQTHTRLVLNFPDSCMTHEIYKSFENNLSLVEKDEKQCRVILCPSSATANEENEIQIEIYTPGFFCSLFESHPSTIGQSLCFSFIRNEVDFDVVFLKWFFCETESRESEDQKEKEGLLSKGRNDCERGWVQDLLTRPPPSSLHVKEAHLFTIPVLKRHNTPQFVWPTHQQTLILLHYLESQILGGWFKSVADFVASPFEFEQRVCQRFKEFQDEEWEKLDLAQEPPREGLELEEFKSFQSFRMWKDLYDD